MPKIYREEKQRRLWKYFSCLHRGQIRDTPVKLPQSWTWKTLRQLEPGISLPPYDLVLVGRIKGKRNADKNPLRESWNTCFSYYSKRFRSWMLVIRRLVAQWLSNSCHSVIHSNYIQCRDTNWCGGVSIIFEFNISNRAVNSLWSMSNVGRSFLATFCYLLLFQSLSKKGSLYKGTVCGTCQMPRAPQQQSKRTLHVCHHLEIEHVNCQELPENGK